MDYFKACSLSYSVVFIIFYFLLNATQAGNNFWLSNWSGRAQKEEELLKNGTNFTSTKYIDLGVYTSLGIFQCLFKKLFKQIKTYFYNFSKRCSNVYW